MMGTREVVLAALDRELPQSRPNLCNATGFDDRQVGNALNNLKNDGSAKRIADGWIRTDLSDTPTVTHTNGGARRIPSMAEMLTGSGPVESNSSGIPNGSIDAAPHAQPATAPKTNGATAHIPSFAKAKSLPAVVGDGPYGEIVQLAETRRAALRAELDELDVFLRVAKTLLPA